MTQPTPQNSLVRHDIFISYSRKNRDFVLTLVHALREHGREAWIDLDEIPPSAQWWEEIKRGIYASHTFVPIITPESLSSPICTLEMDYAMQNNKRIIPIMYIEPARAQTLGNIAAIEPTGFLAEIVGDIDLLQVARKNLKVVEKTNWIRMRQEDDFGAALDQFLYILGIDLDRVRLHARLLVRAHEWDERQRDSSLLLVGSELREAENWLRDYGEQSPMATPQQRMFIEASVVHEQTQRKAEEQRKQELIEISNRAEHQQRRSRRTLFAVSILSALILIGVVLLTTVLVKNAQQEVVNAAATLTALPPDLVAAIREIGARERVIESQRLADEAQSLLLNDGDAETAALLAIRGLNGAYSAEADAVLAQSLDRLYAVRLIAPYTQDFDALALSPNLHYTVTSDYIGDSDFTAYLWDMESNQVLHRLVGHQNNVYNALFTDDETRVITSSADETVRVWDVATGQLLHTLDHADTNGVSFMRLSPNGQYLVSGDTNRALKLWNLESGYQITSISTEMGLSDVLFSPNSDFLLTYQQRHQTGPQFLLRTSDGTPALQLADGAKAAAFSADGRWVAVVDNSDAVHVWLNPLLMTGAEAWVFYHSEVQQIAFTPDNQYLLVTDGSDLTRHPLGIFDTTGEKVWHNFQSESRLLFSPDGRYVVAGTELVDLTSDSIFVHTLNVPLLAWHPSSEFYLGSDQNGIALYDLHDVLIRRFFGQYGRIDPHAFSADGRYLFTRNGDGIRVWDSDVNALNHSRFSRTWTGSLASISPDGQIVAITNGTMVVLWSRETSSYMSSFAFHNDEIIGLDFSDDSRTLLTGSLDGRAMLIDVASNAILQTFTLNTEGDEINAVDISPNGDPVLLSGHFRLTDSDSLYGLYVFDAASGQPITYLDTDISEASAHYSPSGRYIFVTGSGTFSSEAQVWDGISFNQLTRFDEGYQEDGDFSPDERYLFLPVDNDVVMFATQNWQEIRRFSGHTSLVTRTAITSDGQHLLAGARSGDVRMWNTETGELERVFAGEGEIVTELSLTTDGRYLLTTDSAGTIRLWDMRLEDTLTYACSRVFRDFWVTRLLNERSLYGIADESPTCPQLASE